MPRMGPISSKKFEKFLVYIGCEFKRQESSHRAYTRAGLNRPIIVPQYDELPLFIIKNNLRVLGISHKQFSEIIKKVK